MDSATKQEFTRRISQSNRTGLLLIMYEIFFTYINDARKDRDLDKHDEFKENVRHADDVLVRLKEDLDFKYPISADLFKLYTFAQTKLSLSMVHYRKEELDIARNIIYPIYEAFSQIAEGDDSKPLMSNTQEVYVGMTYGRGSLTEDIHGNTNRGFLA